MTILELRRQEIESVTLTQEEIDYAIWEAKLRNESMKVELYGLIDAWLAIDKTKMV